MSGINRSTSNINTTMTSPTTDSPHSSQELLDPESGHKRAFPAFTDTAVTPLSPVINFNSRQMKVLAGVMMAYFGYYFCRTDVILCINMISASVGVDKAQIGTVLSFGYFAFAIGKLFQGLLIDKYGGKPILISCLLLSILVTITLTMVKVNHENPDGYLALFGVLWCLNRLFQSGGWGSVLAILSKTFPRQVHGQVIGFATISYGIGDAGVRMILGKVLEQEIFHRAVPELTRDNAELIWKRVFTVAAYSSAILLMITYVLLRNPKRSIFYAHESSKTPKIRTSLSSTISSLTSKPKFWVLLCLSFTLTFLRETILTWLSIFLSEYLHINDGTSAMLSLLFPLFGTVSTVVGGYLLDHSLPHKKGMLLTGFLGSLVCILSIVMFDMTGTTHRHSVAVAATFVSLVAVTTMAPFAYVDSILPLDLCSYSEIGITIGFMNFSGYIGAILAGHEVGLISDTHGWSAVLGVLWIVSIISVLLAGLYWFLDVKESRSSTNWQSSGSEDDLSPS